MGKRQKRLIVAVLSLLTSLIVLIGTPPAPAFAGEGECEGECVPVGECPEFSCAEVDGCSGTAPPVCPVMENCGQGEVYWYCPE
jgi:hypothetical protein